MLIIEVNAQPNGGHRNQRGDFLTVPEGWAEVPASVAIPGSFPFMQAEVSDGVVTSLLPAPVPEQGPTEPTAQDDMDAILVDHEYRLTLLELGVI